MPIIQPYLCLLWWQYFQYESSGASLGLIQWQFIKRSKAVWQILIGIQFEK